MNIHFDWRVALHRDDQEALRHMGQALHKETAAAAKPERDRQHRDDGPVLEEKVVLTHLETDSETDFELDAGGDPVKGIGIAVIAGAAIWIALATAFVLL